MTDLVKQEERLARVLRKGLIQERTAEKQLGEVARLRQDAATRLRRLKLRQESTARAGEMSQDLESELKALSKGISRASVEDWQRVLALLCPPRSIRVHPDGKLQIPPDLQALDASTKPSSSSTSTAPW